MFWIRQTDHSEEGPLTGAQVRDAIARRRLNAQSSIRADTEQEWKPLRTFAEFAPALQLAGAFDPASKTPGASPKTSTVALTAFCLSVFGFCGFTAVAGLILGAIAWFQIKKRPGQFEGLRYANAAMLISLFFLIVLPIAFSTVTNRAQRTMRRQWMNNCHTHVRSLSNAIRIYAVANNGALPPADAWCDALRREIATLDQYRCPNDTNRTRCSYALNEKIFDAESIDPKTVVLFEANLDWNGVGTVTNMIEQPRHGGYVVVALADGSIQAVPPAQAKKLRWDP